MQATCGEHFRWAAIGAPLTVPGTRHWPCLACSLPALATEDNVLCGVARLRLKRSTCAQGSACAGSRGCTSPAWGSGPTSGTLTRRRTSGCGPAPQGRRTGPLPPGSQRCLACCAAPCALPARRHRLQRCNSRRRCQPRDSSAGGRVGRQAHPQSRARARQSSACSAAGAPPRAAGDHGRARQRQCGLERRRYGRKLPRAGPRGGGDRRGHAGLRPPARPPGLGRCCAAARALPACCAGGRESVPALLGLDLLTPWHDCHFW